LPFFASLNVNDASFRLVILSEAKDMLSAVLAKGLGFAQDDN
jgi:hypothetical protein